MGYSSGDTIVAVSSPAGASACGIVRISGPGAIAAAAALFASRQGPAFASRPGGQIVQGEVRLRLLQEKTVPGGASQPCPCLAYLMRAPASYTGEDMVELHLPGAPPIVAGLVAELYAGGCRPAEAGEFTLRAFRSGRIDLGQAESVERLISAGSERERREALGRLGSGLGRRLAAWQQALVACAARAEALLDLDEEELGEDLASGLAEQVCELAIACGEMASQATDLPPAAEGNRVALVGPVNAGKSSLANALLGEDRSLVSSEPATTRDRLAFPLRIGELRLLLEDNPGLHERRDPVTAAALDLAAARLPAAALVCLVLDAADPRPEVIAAWQRPLSGARALLVLNKLDLVADAEACARAEARLRQACAAAGIQALAAIRTSAKDGRGLGELKREMRAALLANRPGDAGNLASAREAEEIGRAARACQAAADLCCRGNAWELVAEELRAAGAALSRAGGQGYGEEVLTRIFARFCVGK